MTEEDEAFEDLAKRQGYWGLQGSRKHQIMRYAENVEIKETSMTDKELMAMALEALETLMLERGSIYEQAITALKEALAQPEQEPVAVKRMKEWVEFLKRQSDNGQHMNIPSSFGAGTCWELAIELEQFINTQPPQRTEQEPVELPCCGYTDASAIKWNSFNGVVQCHNCGQTYTPPQRT